MGAYTHNYNKRNPHGMAANSLLSSSFNDVMYENDSQKNWDNDPKNLKKSQRQQRGADGKFEATMRDDEPMYMESFGQEVGRSRKKTIKPEFEI